MLLGINWHKDTVIGSFREIFTDNSVRNAFGTHLINTLNGGYLRYPGGEYVEHMPLDEGLAESDYSMPGYPVFYRFCSDYGLKVLQQLPTYGWLSKDGRRTIKNWTKGEIDWKAADEMVSRAASFVRWVFDNGYDKNVVLWQIGNEDWHDIEGALRPDEYVQVFERYISAIGGLVPPGKILVVAQPGRRGGSKDWGREVLKLLRDKGYEGSFCGATMHIYPYHLNRREFDKGDFNFNSYCTGDYLSEALSAEFKGLTDALEDLGYDEKIKAHITEISVEIAGPPGDGGRQTFGNNRKNYAAAYAAARSVLALAGEKRFGGAAYYCLTHKYIIAPEEKNPTRWQGYSRAGDWGWGQCWHIPENLKNTFLNTPLLEAWSMITRFLNRVASSGELNAGSQAKAFMGAESNKAAVRLFLINTGNKTINMDIAGRTQGLILGDGDLDKRVLKLGSYGSHEDITPLRTKEVRLSGNMSVPPYAMFYAEGKDLKINGVRLTPELLRTRAYLNETELPLGSFDVRYENGRLVPFPEGVRIENYPLSLIDGLKGRTEDDTSREVFGAPYEDLAEWSIGDEEEYS